jgi:hypothetical protein
MNVDVGQLVREFRNKYGSGAAALRALGVTPRLAFDEDEPETVSEWLRRKGVSDADIAEFKRRCDEGAEDEEEEAEEGALRATRASVRLTTRGSAISFRASTNSCETSFKATISIHIGRCSTSF